MPDAAQVRVERNHILAAGSVGEVSPLAGDRVDAERAEVAVNACRIARHMFAAVPPAVRKPAHQQRRNLATMVRTHIGQPWHVSADARGVLRGAILQLFAAFEPGAQPKAAWAAASKPEIVGHTLATAFLYDQQTGLPRRSMAQLEMRRAELWKNELADTTSELALVEITPQEKHQMGSRIIAVESEPAGTWCWRYGGDVKGGFASEADAVADVSRAIHERRSHE